MPSPSDTQNNTHNPVISLISLSRRLAEVIAAENRHIEDRQPQEAQKLHQEKGRLAAAYAREMDMVRKNGGVTAFGTADQLRELKRQTGNFQRLLDEHRRLVERSRFVTEGILKAIGDEVARRNRPANGYGKNAVPERKGYTPPTSLTLNQII